MADPWFDPTRWAWLPGTALGVIGGLWGSLAGLYAGRARGWVVGSMWVWFIGSVLLLLAGVVALGQGQPYGVWYGLGLPGLLGTIMGGVFLAVLAPAFREAERQAEERRMQARDLG